MGPHRPDGPSGVELGAMGAFLAAVVVIFLFLGLAVDGALHSGPVGLLAGVALGVIAAGAGVYVRFKRYL